MTFTVPANVPWFPTGIHLARNQRCRITASVAPGDEPYKDSAFRCTPDGPATVAGRMFDRIARDASAPYNAFRWYGPGAIRRLRVLEDRTGKAGHFLSLIAAIGRDDSAANVLVIGSGRDFEAHAGGELVLFSNDWPGGPGTMGEERFTGSKSYKNNRGALRVTVERG